MKKEKGNVIALLPIGVFLILYLGLGILFEYIMINNLNDSNEDANRLVTLLDGIICRVDLIPANDSGQEKFKPSTPEQLNRFVSILNEKGINASIRGTVGEDIKAACGQLRAEKI